MKKIIFASLIVLIALSCKKTQFSPEGPTDIRIINLSDQVFTGVIVTTSEYTEDTDTLGIIKNGDVTEYHRFKKAYPKLEISAQINVGGTLVTFSTGTVNFTYLTYLGQDRITYEVYIKSMTTHELVVNNCIREEPLVAK